MNITMDQYLMGREVRFKKDLTNEILANARDLLTRVNAILALAAKENIAPKEVGHPPSPVASGWRPPTVNASTANAAIGSKHLSGRAIDLHDDVGRNLARFCLRNLATLEELGLWMEDPRWTPTWVHLQSVAPGSGNRVYVPSSKPPLAPQLPEQRRGDLT